jgi:RNA polymerase sigma factor (sigma-70 family)
MSMQRELVEQAIRGDHDAFSELVRLSSRKLYAVATLILRDKTRAEDATQEALVAAWRDLSGLRDPDRFDAWLHRVLVRECYREAKRERRRIEVEGQIRPVTEAADPGLATADREELERGFARLPVDQRTVLVLHHYVGYSFPEIAETLGIPVGTAKSRVHRAASAMRAALTADRRPATTGRTSA